MKESMTATRLQNLGSGYKQAGAFKAAIKLDLFTVIAQGTREISQIAQEIGLSHQNARSLVDVCSALDLVEFKDGLYYNAADVERYLVKGKRGYKGLWLGRGGEEEFKLWSDITPLLKGERQPAGIWGPPVDLEAARRSNQATYGLSIGAGYKLAREFDFSPYSLLLDLGGGSGCYSIAIANTYPKIKAIVIDYPIVCTSTAEIIAEAGLSERITTHPGDLLEVDFPPGADLILVIGNLNMFDVPGLMTVYRKAVDAVEKGGTMMVIGEALFDDRSGPLEAALFQLEHTLTLGQGVPHTWSDVCQHLREAGFIDCKASEFVRGVSTMFVARKPK